MSSYNCDPSEFPPVPADKTFSLECVVVCSNYSDFLQYTMPHNKQFFERLVIVTSPEDKATQHLCTFYNVQCVKSEHLAGGKIEKGAAINDGLRVLGRRNWLLHLDADIWLPPMTRQILQQANLDKRFIYGIDRFNVRGLKTWINFMSKPALQHADYAYILLNSGLPMGTRLTQAHLGGYLPLGFFQMWHPNDSGVQWYPEEHTTAAHGDLRMSNLWPRGRRALIPEIVGYHLESEDAAFGSNWQGRKTKPFTL